MRAQSGAQIWPKTRFLAISQRGPLLVTKGHIWSHLVTLSSLGINHSWSLVMVSGHIWAYLVTKSRHLVTIVTIGSKMANWSHFDIFTTLLSMVTCS